MIPNYTSIKAFELALQENTLAIPSYQTHCGHLPLVISPEELAKVHNNRVFIELSNSGLTAVSRSNVRAQVESSRQFTFQQKEYMKCQAINQALRNLILKLTPSSNPLPLLQH